MRSIASTSAETIAASLMSPAPSVLQAQPLPQRSPWHSPVPYLFGGLAAMLGLIAFALLILACSYWRLAGQMDEREGRDDRDFESGEGKEGGDPEGKVVKVYEEKILVIMAGDQKPTFLATPVCSKAASFTDANHVKGENRDREGDKAQNCETMKKDVDDHDVHAAAEDNNRESEETSEAQDHHQ